MLFGFVAVLTTTPVDSRWLDPRCRSGVVQRSASQAPLDAWFLWWVVCYDPRAETELSCPWQGGLGSFGCRMTDPFRRVPHEALLALGLDVRNGHCRDAYGARDLRNCVPRLAAALPDVPACSDGGARTRLRGVRTRSRLLFLPTRLVSLSERGRLVGTYG